MRLGHRRVGILQSVRIGFWLWELDGHRTREVREEPSVRRMNTRDFGFELMYTLPASSQQCKAVLYAEYVHEPF